MPDKEPKPFPHMDMAQANSECNHRAHQVFDNCQMCKQRVGLHCAECVIQVTGCLCTEYERFGNDAGWKRAVDMFGEELARERARSAGLWVPDAPRLL